MAGVKVDITSLSEEERAEIIVRAGEPTYRLTQLERWLFTRAAAGFAEMSDLPGKFREFLANEFYVPAPQIADKKQDADGTTKYLFQMAAGDAVEAVYIPERDHDVACVSSQVGCSFKCEICATGRVPFRRNLSAYEIFVQTALMNRLGEGGRRIRNVVFMGQGEPFANYEAVAGAVMLLKKFLDIGGRRITISTAGLPDKIAAWADGGPATKLAVSLHSAVQETRDELMPWAKRYALTELTAACKYYTRKTGRRLTFEYVLVAGVNDDRRHARALVALTRDIPCKINVLTLNPWPGVKYAPPPPAVVERFLAEVAAGPRALTFRKPRGQTIHAACGTLANR